MFNISQNLLDISKNFKKEEFDSVKEGFKKIISDIGGVSLTDTEFILDKNTFKLKTLGAKKVRLAMFLEEIREQMLKNSLLTKFTLQG
jgi:hypothetical protein